MGGCARERKEGIFKNQASSGQGGACHNQKTKALIGNKERNIKKGSLDGGREDGRRRACPSELIYSGLLERHVARSCKPHHEEDARIRRRAHLAFESSHNCLQHRHSTLFNEIISTTKPCVYVIHSRDPSKQTKLRQREEKREKKKRKKRSTDKIRTVSKIRATRAHRSNTTRTSNKRTGNIMNGKRLSMPSHPALTAPLAPLVVRPCRRKGLANTSSQLLVISSARAPH